MTIFHLPYMNDVKIFHLPYTKWTRQCMLARMLACWDQTFKLCVLCAEVSVFHYPRLTLPWRYITLPLLNDSPERTTDWQINITDKHTDWSTWTLDQPFTHKMMIRYVAVDDKKQIRWVGTKMPVTQLTTTLPYTPEVLYTLPQSLGILNSYSPSESCNAAKTKKTKTKK